MLPSARTVGGGRVAGVTVLVVVLVVVLVSGCGSGRTGPINPSSTAPAPSATPPSSASARPAPPTLTARQKARGCRLGDPRAGINSPKRLIVKGACVTVHGTVGCIIMSSDDGDAHLALKLDPGQSKYLRPGNKAWACGPDPAPMVVEIIPQHCEDLPDNCADSAHFKSPRIPREGQHVTITGAWVLDTAHYHGRTHWAEIHPVWKVTVG